MKYLSLLISLAFTAVFSSACVDECKEDDPIGTNCYCPYCDPSPVCVDRQGSCYNGSGSSNNGVTCSGLEPTENARGFPVTVVDDATRCIVDRSSHFANSEAEAIGCASRPGATAHGGDELCVFFVTIECDSGDGCGFNGVEGRTREEAIACARNTLSNCNLLDVSDQSNPNHVCRTQPSNTGTVPCPAHPED